MAILAVALVVIGLVFGPLALIWALNTLFGLSLPYTLTNWFAAFLLVAVFGR
jgi:hypothetical protein